MARAGYTTGETGSLVNLLASRMGKQQVMDAVKIGDGATRLGWSDRYPATVIDVRGTEKRPVIVIQEDTATRVDDRGMYTDWQEYTYSRNYAGEVSEVTFRKGAWRIKGTDQAVAFGYRSRYRDPSF